MIDFRYHIVSLVAVFLALALGLFLGSTTLQSTVTHSLQHQADVLTAHNHNVENANTQLKNQLGAEQSFDAAVTPYAVAGKLANSTVVVISAPGVDSGDRSQIIATLTMADATVTADVRLQSGFLDPNQDNTLGQLAAQVAGNRPLPQTSGVGQASAVLARALVSRPGSSLPTSQRIGTILGTFSDAKMIQLSGQPPVRPADLALLLVPLGGNPDNSATAVAQDHDLVALAEVLQRGSTGLVVAAPTSSPTSNAGALAAIQSDPVLSKVVSTVDVDNTAAGRIATVLALSLAPSGSVGKYGQASGDQPLPSLSPGP